MRGLQKTGLALIWVLLTLTSTWAAGPGDTANPAAESGIQFTDEAWAAIVKKAKAENKIIFLDAYASWCGPCKLLQKNVFTRSDVGELFNKNFINVKVDMERGEGHNCRGCFRWKRIPPYFSLSRVVKSYEK